MASEDALPAKRARLEGTFSPVIAGDIVDVQAGSGTESKIFHVHKDVLANSPFFFKAMKPEWAREPKKPIDLSDETPEIVEKYLTWLYSHSIAETTDFAMLFRLFVLGNKLAHNDYQNAVLDAIMHLCEASTKIPRPRLINIIYYGTTKASPARKLMGTTIVYMRHRPCLTSHFG